MITEELMREWAINSYFASNPRYEGFDNVVVECIPDVCKRKSELIKFNGTSEFNGSMVLPIPTNGKKYILINSNILKSKDPLIYVETLIHELVHLIQYSEFSERYFNSDYTLICKDEDWLPFYFWSEFSAKKAGLLFYFYAQKDLLGLKTDVLMKDMHDLFLPYELKTYVNLRNKFDNEQINSVEFLYGFFRTLAQISTWQECFYTNISNQLLDMFFQKDASGVKTLIDILQTTSESVQLKNNNASIIRQQVLEVCSINLE